MGIVFAFLEFFDICYRRNEFREPMIALGSLEINESEKAISEFAAGNRYWNVAEGASVRSLLRDRYQVKAYSDCDLNEKADIKIDLNKPLEMKLYNSAMTVLNGGTLEHVFDIAQTMKNIHDMSCQGGTIIHLAPVSWYEHGYYNFNPRMFAAVAKANHYSLLAEAYWINREIAVTPPRWISAVGPGGIIKGLYRRWGGKVRKGCEPLEVSGIGYDDRALFITFDGETRTRWHGVICSMLAGNAVPANSLYLAAYRKNDGHAFVHPGEASEKNGWRVRP